MADTDIIYVIVSGLAQVIVTCLLSSSLLYVIQSTYRSLGILRAICMRENGKKVLIFLKVLETKLETHLVLV